MPTTQQPGHGGQISIDRKTVESMQQRGRTRMVQAVFYESGLGDPERMYDFWRGFAFGAKALLDGSAQVMASHDQATQLEGVVQAALTALPDDIEGLSLSEMKRLVASQGIDIASDVIPNLNVDAVVQLQNGMRTAGELDDKHAVAAIDVQDGGVLHYSPFVTETCIVGEES